MKKINLFVFFLGCLILNSCVEPKRDYVIAIIKTSINNKTNHVIKFLPYQNGLLITDSVKVFLPNSISLLESVKYNIPSSLATNFYSKYQENTDYIIVTFDDLKSVKHQNFKTNPIEAPYLPSKERSLYSNFGGVYEQKIIEQRKGDIKTEFTYTFTEQDYLDAEVIK